MDVMDRRFRIASSGVLTLLMLVSQAVAPASAAGSSLVGRWSLTVTMPEAPRGRSTRTFTINLDVKPLQGLVGRMTITDEHNTTVGGVWRQVGKTVSITYELPCPGADGALCATLVLTGKVKAEGIRLKKGKVIVMWDTENEQDPSFFDTSLGNFSGTRIL